MNQRMQFVTALLMMLHRKGVNQSAVKYLKYSRNRIKLKKLKASSAFSAICRHCTALLSFPLGTRTIVQVLAEND